MPTSISSVLALSGEFIFTQRPVWIIQHKPKTTYPFVIFLFVNTFSLAVESDTLNADGLDADEQEQEVLHSAKQLVEREILRRRPKLLRQR